MELLIRANRSRRASIERPQSSRELDRQRRRYPFVLLAVVAASSCLSPTLPLPPPNQPDVEGPDGSGNVTLSGEVMRGANVYANNLNSGASAGQKADPNTGKYRFRIAASLGDRMELFYIYDSVSSDRTYFSIGTPISPTPSTTWPDAGISFGNVDASVAPPR